MINVVHVCKDFIFPFSVADNLKGGLKSRVKSYIPM